MDAKALAAIHAMAQLVEQLALVVKQVCPVEQASLQHELERIATEARRIGRK